MGNILYLLLALGVFALGLLFIWARGKFASFSRGTSVDVFRRDMSALQQSPKPVVTSRQTQPLNRAQPSGTVRVIPNDDPETDR